jgi:hypothetical protein
MPTTGQGLTATENVGRGFILHSGLSQPHQMQVPITQDYLLMNSVAYQSGGLGSSSPSEIRKF